MKKLLVIVLLIFVSQLLLAQVGFFGMGYNVGYGEFQGFNYVVDRYNETRSYLTQEMDHVELTHGMSFDLGYAMPGFLGGMGLQYNRAKVSAIGIIDGEKVQRDLKIHALNIPFDFAIAIGEYDFSWAPGIGFNFLLWKYLTRTGKPSKIDEVDYYKSSVDAGIHLKLFTKFIFGGVSEDGWGLVVEPYYNLGVLGSEMWQMNQALNPNTYYNDPKKSEKFSHYGVRMMVLYKFGA